MSAGRSCLARALALALGLAIGLMAAAAHAQPGVELTIRADAARSGVAFRVANPTPHRSAPARVEFTVQRAGRVIAREERTIAPIEPFAERTVAPAEWVRLAPGVGRACVISVRRRCVEQTLPGTEPDLRIGAARLDGPTLVVEVHNDGDGASPACMLRRSSRGGGRLVGSARHAVAALPARSRQELRLPFELWGSQRARPGVVPPDCCETELEIDVDGAVPETNERNNRFRWSHPAPGS